METKISCRCRTPKFYILQCAGKNAKGHQACPKDIKEGDPGNVCTEGNGVKGDEDGPKSEQEK